MSFIKVSLVADQVAILLGLTHTYSQQYVGQLEQKIKAAATDAEARELAKVGLNFVAAKLDLDKALYAMLDEGETREALDNKAPYEVLFVVSEHKFLTSVLGSGTLDRSHPAAKGHTEEQITRAEVLIQGTRDALAAGVEMTVEQVTEARAAYAKTATKSDAELLKGFFVQNKVGLA